MQEEELVVAVLGILLPIVITLGAFIMVVYIRKYENLERMSMIEKGVSPDFFKRPRFTSGALRASLLLIGIGIGFLVGYWLDSTFRMEEVGYFAMLFIMGGAGLGISYIIEEKREKRL